MPKEKEYVLKDILKKHNSSQKNFAEWLGITEQGLIKAINKGLNKSYLCSLQIYLMELRGINIDIEYDIFE